MRVASYTRLEGDGHNDPPSCSRSICNQEDIKGRLPTDDLPDPPFLPRARLTRVVSTERLHVNTASHMVSQAHMGVRLRRF